MSPDCLSARISSVYATRIITTPGEKSSTRPFMCTMPTPIQCQWKRRSGGSGGTGGFTVIAGAEYFIGNDPGEGNATALQPKDGAFDSEVESTLTASLSLNGYALGPISWGCATWTTTEPGEMCSTKRLKWMSIPMGTDSRTKRKFIMRLIPRCRIPMETATSTARRSPLAVTPPTLNSTRQPGPHRSSMPPFCDFGKPAGRGIRG